MTRSRKILGLVTLATLQLGGAAAAQPSKPMVGKNGRPVCGNTLSKSGGTGRRRELQANLTALSKLVEKGDDQKNKSYRDQLVARVRHDLEQLEACEPAPAPAAKPRTAAATRP